MKVFISWSGHQSRQIAEAFRDWLPAIFESVDPYMSARDNEAGVRWSNVISKRLDESDFGILCLTPENLNAPWLLFEAGALSKSVDVARVVPLLHGLGPTDVTAPLSQFHMKQANEEGLRDIITAINAALPQSRTDHALATAFTALWPIFKEKLDNVTPGPPTEKPERTDRSILEEILQLQRSQVTPVAFSASPWRSEGVVDVAMLSSVAAAAGVSTSTANRALSGHPSVLPSTRARVEAAAAAQREALPALTAYLAAHEPSLSATVMDNYPVGFRIDVPDRESAEIVLELLRGATLGIDANMLSVHWPDKDRAAATEIPPDETRT